jgi:hypothetical protein
MLAKTVSRRGVKEAEEGKVEAGAGYSYVGAEKVGRRCREESGSAEYV